jgi:hypothetical protein
MNKGNQSCGVYPAAVLVYFALAERQIAYAAHTFYPMFTGSDWDDPRRVATQPELRLCSKVLGVNV